MNDANLLKKAFIRGLGIQPDTDFDTLRYREIDEWTSVAHMSLVAEIEATFDIMLSTEDVIGMNSFLRAKEILANHGVEIDS